MIDILKDIQALVSSELHMEIIHFPGDNQVWQMGLGKFNIPQHDRPVA